MKNGPGAGGAAAIAVAVTAFFGGRIFLVAVLVLAAVALLELVGELDRLGPRPVVVAAAVGALGTPLRVSLTSENALGGMSALLVTMVLLTFVLLIATGRRVDVTAALGATLLCGLLVGLGGGALVLLERPPAGWPWIVALLVVAAVAEAVLRTRPRPMPASASLRVGLVVLAGAPALALLATAVAG